MRLTLIAVALTALSPINGWSQRGRVANVAGVPVIGEQSALEAAAALQRIGDTATARVIRQAATTQGLDQSFEDMTLPRDEPYRYTAHVFGYIPTSPGPLTGLQSIQNAENIQPDRSLRNAALKITLDRLRVFRYPGRGVHEVLFDFYALHQAAIGQTQDLHFSQTYRVLEGSSAGMTGYPVFLGLRSGSEGIDFRVSTVNVGNEGDKQILGFLDNDVFKSGLKLINSVNPVIPVVTQFAQGITTTFAHRNDNIPVQAFQMGLDFSNIPTRARLREGSYIAVQIPDPARWSWSDWALNPENGTLVSRSNPTVGIPYNYIVFSVSRMEDPETSTPRVQPSTPPAPPSPAPKR